MSITERLFREIKFGEGRDFANTASDLGEVGSRDGCVSSESRVKDEIDLEPFKIFNNGELFRKVVAHRKVGSLRDE